MSRPPHRPTNAPATPLGGGGVEHLRKAFALFQQGNLRGAEKAARLFLKAAPDHPDGNNLLGMVAFQQGNLDAAADLTGRAAAASNSPELHKNHGYTLKALGRLDAAVEAYGRALSIDPLNAAAWNDQGTVLSALGRTQEAGESFRHAISLAPKDPKAYVNLSNMMIRVGRANDAVGIARQAVEITPGLAAAHNVLGNALRDLGDIDEAVACFEQARVVEPDTIDATTNLAALYEETNRLNEAQALCEALLVRYPGNPAASLILSRCLRRDARIDDALVVIERALHEPMSADVDRDVQHEAALLYDRRGDAQAAFDATVRSNLLAMQSLGVDETLGDSFITRIDALTAWMTSAVAARIAMHKDRHDKDGQIDPIFVVGFPRSGTTMLGQILDSHSSLVMADERDFMDRVLTMMAQVGIDYPGDVADLDAGAIESLRAAYFEAFDARFKREPGQRFVDKLPLHIIHTGLIRLLFPHSKILFALRHPCDVVLSCFMQNFEPNPAMANFMSVERGARTYDKVMLLWRAYEDALAPPVNTVRYESVVSDFDAEIGRVFDFLDLPWEDGVRDFADHARAGSMINTPSYSQVTEKLYTRARYRWRRYEAQLADAMPVLERWIEAYGYGDEG